MYNRFSHINQLLDLYTYEPDIPDEIYKIIQTKLPPNFTIKDIKTILKHNKFNKYYEYSQHIYCKLSNKNNIHISIDTRYKIIKLYTIIYNRHKLVYPNKSMISIYYIMPKILEVINAPLDLKEIFEYKIKSIEKIKKQDEIWNNLGLFKQIKSNL
jgi:hypothetical protein